MGDDRNPTISMLAYTGDLGLSNGVPQSGYALQKAGMTQLKKPNGKMFRVDLQPGETVQLPDGKGSVTFHGVKHWTRLQISRTPDVWVTLLGVVLALRGSYHIYYGPGVFGILVWAALFYWIYLRTGNAVLLMVSHAGWDAVGFLSQRWPGVAGVAWLCPRYEIHAWFGFVGST